MRAETAWSSPWVETHDNDGRRDLLHRDASTNPARRVNDNATTGCPPPWRVLWSTVGFGADTINHKLDEPFDGEDSAVRKALRVTRRGMLAGAAAAASVLAAGRAGWAQTYPTKPVRVIVPYPPAGGADTVSRLLFQKLSEMWGHQFVIDNRGGAGGTIGEAAAAKGDPDGHTGPYHAPPSSTNPP